MMKRSKTKATTHAAVAMGISLALALFLTPHSAHANGYHYDNFRFGQTALGLGGAVVAIPGLPEAAWYNPGGLAFQESSSISGSVHFFGIDRRTLVGGLRAKWHEPKDVTSEDILALPSSSVLSFSMGKGKHTFAFSTFVVVNSTETFSGAFQDTFFENGFNHEVTLSGTSSNADNIVYRGPSYALRINEEWGVGLSVFYISRTQTTTATSGFLDQRTNPNDASDQASIFEDISTFTRIDDGALAARIGATYKHKRLGLGASLTSPSIHLFGEGDIRYSFATSGLPRPNSDEHDPPLKDVTTDTTKAYTSYHMSLSLGASYAAPSRYTLALDARIYAPVSFDRLDLSDADEAAVSPGFNNNVDAEWVVNFAAGAEYIVAKRYPIRVGVYSNRSAAPALNAPPRQLEPAHVDLYGLDFSVGYIGEKAGINLGVEAEYGKGEHIVLREISDLWQPAWQQVPREQYRVIFYIAGALNFLKETGKEVFGVEEDGAEKDDE